MLKRFVALLFAAAALPAMAADLPTHPFIHVNGSSEVRVMPDTGEIDFDIVSLDPDPEAAWKLVAERLDASRALFAQHGVLTDDISAQDIVRRQRKVDRLPEGAPMPMETRVTLHVVVRDLAPWSAMLRSLMAMKDIESLAVAFSHSNREKLEADLVTEAIHEAKTRAQNIARGVGAKLGPATGVSLQSLKNLSNAMGLATEPSSRYNGGGRNAAPPDMELVQAIRLMQMVDVIYRIGGPDRAPAKAR